MAKRSFSPFETRISKLVRSRVASEFKSYGIKLEGGIHLFNKPKNIRLDVAQVACYGARKERVSKDLHLICNINYQDDNYDRVREYTEFLYFRLLDSTLGNNLKFLKGYQNIEFEILKASKTLWFGYCPLSIVHISSLKSI